MNFCYRCSLNQGFRKRQREVLIRRVVLEMDEMKCSEDGVQGFVVVCKPAGRDFVVREADVLQGREGVTVGVAKDGRGDEGRTDDRDGVQPREQVEGLKTRSRRFGEKLIAVGSDGEGAEALAELHDPVESVLVEFCGL